MPPEIKWIKLMLNLFDTDNIKLVRSMPDGATLLMIWVQLNVLAGRCNAGGHIAMPSGQPYSEEDLAIVLGHPTLTVRLALVTFAKLRMATEDQGLLFLPTFAEEQNIEGMEKIRAEWREAQRKLREKRRQLSLPEPKTPMTSYDSHNTDIEVDIEEEEEEEEKRGITGSQAEKIWTDVLSELRTGISDVNFRTWLEKTKGFELEDHTLKVEVSSAFVRDYLTRNQLTLINKAICGQMHDDFHVQFVLAARES